MSGSPQFRIPSASSMLTKWHENSQLRNYTPLLPTITTRLMEQALSSGAPLALHGSNGSDYTLTIFDSVQLPAISIVDYLMHIQRHSRGSSSMWICMYVLIQRINAVGNVPFTPLRAHRMILTAALIASKVTDDFGRSNKSYGTLGGLVMTELNKLEENFLRLIDFKGNVLGSEWDCAMSELTSIGSQKGLLTDSLASELPNSPRFTPGCKLVEDFVSSDSESTPPRGACGAARRVVSPLSPGPLSPLEEKERGVFATAEKAGKKYGGVKGQAAQKTVSQSSEFTGSQRRVSVAMGQAGGSMADGSERRVGSDGVVRTKEECVKLFEGNETKASKEWDSSAPYTTKKQKNGMMGCLSFVLPKVGGRKSNSSSINGKCG